MKQKLFIFISLAALFLSTCGASPLASDPLNGTSWELFAISKQRPIEGSTITIAFEDGQVSGNSGCNSYGSEYQVSRRKIEFGTIWSTVMACADSPLYGTGNDQHAAFEKRPKVRIGRWSVADLLV